MAYFDIAMLSSDGDFVARIAACYSVETLLDAGRINPSEWATTHAWDIASAPGFGDAYASAIAAEVERPGKDPSVITDEQLLSAVQAVMTGPSSA